MPDLAFAKRVQEILAAACYQWFAANTEDPDRGWTPEALAFRRLLRQQVPTTVWTGNLDGAPVVWVQRHARTKRWHVETAPLPADIADHLAGSTHMVTFPTGPYLFALRGLDSGLLFLPRPGDHGPFDMALSHDMAVAVSTWRRQLAEAYTIIGRRPLTLRVDDPPPRPHAAIALVGQWVNGQTRHLEYADLLKRVREWAPLTCVPEEVAFVLERCLRLFLLGYQEWDLFTVSNHYAGLALEASLRWLYWRCLAYPATLEWRDADNHVRKRVDLAKPTSDWVGQWPLRRTANKGPWRLWVNSQRLDARKTSLVDWARRQQWLGPEEIRRAHGLLAFRDLFSHPTGPHVQWYGWVHDDVETSAALINAMWSRWAYPDRVPWSGVFWTRPRWASRPKAP